jgi:ATP-dependent Clp protease ATP-binding subunit ClpA
VFERFSHQARSVVFRAQAIGRRMGSRRIGTEHMLLGLLDDARSLPAQLLNRHGLDRASAEAAILRHLGASEPSPDELDAAALESIGIDLTEVKAKVESAFGAGALDRDPISHPKGGLISGRHIPFSPRAKKVLELALREALSLGHKYIGDGHILLGLLREGRGLAALVIAEAGIDGGRLRAELIAQIPPTREP